MYKLPFNNDKLRGEELYKILEVNSPGEKQDFEIFRENCLVQLIVNEIRRTDNRLSISINDFSDSLLGVLQAYFFMKNRLK